MKAKLKAVLSAVFLSVALFIDYEKIYGDVMAVRDPFNIGVFAVSVITVVFAYVFIKINKTSKMHYTRKILSFVFSLCMVFGNSFKLTNSWDLVFGNPLMIFISIVAFVGYYVLFKNLFYVMDNVLDKIKEKEIKTTKFKKLITFFDQRPFLSSFIILIIFWLIYMIAFYPIILSPDPSFQIKQFFNVHTKYADYVLRPVETVYMTNHHPVMHTLLLGGFIKLGRFFGSDNVGLFMYSITQTIVLASALACTIKFLKKNGVGVKRRLILLATYALVPMFPLYAMSGVKDTYYTAFIIFYVMFMFNFIKNMKNEKLTIKQMIFILINLLLIALFRNNGIYVIVLSFPLLFFFSRKNVIRTILVFVLTIGLYGTYTKVILPHYGIADGSIREVLTIPFQQTARYAKEHESDLSKDDKKVIDKVLGYDDLSERYDPKISDPVKNNYNKYATSEDLKNYFKVWGDGLLKHPGTYVEATLNNTYGYLYPNDTNWYVYSKFDKRITEDNLVDYHYNGLGWLRNILAGYGIAFPYVPIVGLVSNIGFSAWLMLIIISILIENKKARYIIALMPLLISLIICFASPVNTYFRYSMPYVFAMPMVIMLLLNIVKGSVINEEK